MPGPKYWPLSQDANKPSGVCAVCWSVRQLHLKDNTVHHHGPRDHPCAGLDRSPLRDIHSGGEPSSIVSLARPLTFPVIFHCTVYNVLQPQLLNTFLKLQQLCEPPVSPATFASPPAARYM